MLIFTDGIPEIKLQNSNHYFGLRRFSRLFESTRAMPVDVAANSMISNVDELHGGQKQEDDWTLVIIEWG
jgi:serine phosphatase RsbU (regulator of sigma subunit)